MIDAHEYNGAAAAESAQPDTEELEVASMVPMDDAAGGPTGDADEDDEEYKESDGDADDDVAEESGETD